VGKVLSDPLVRPCDVEIVEAVFLQHVVEVPLGVDDDVIEALSADAAKDLSHTEFMSGA
jgi:hypothetical protein